METTAIAQFNNPARLQLIKDAVCRGSTDEEFELFINTCQHLQLDPFAGQITFMRRWDSSLKREVGQALVTIGGLRSVAERSGEYEGQTPPQWCGRDGVWTEVWLGDEPPAAARVGVLRKGFREPCYGVATYNSYCQKRKDGTPTATWSRMSDVMLCKCAEAAALRKSFPSQLGNVYTHEEMGYDPPPPHDGERRLSAEEALLEKQVGDDPTPYEWAAEQLRKAAPAGAAELRRVAKRDGPRLTLADQDKYRQLFKELAETTKA